MIRHFQPLDEVVETLPGLRETLIEVVETFADPFETLLELVEGPSKNG